MHDVDRGRGAVVRVRHPAREQQVAVVGLCVGSDVALLTGGVIGISALLYTCPQVLAVTRLTGATFLLGYGILAARRAMRPQGLTPSEDTPARLARVVLTWLAVTFQNPHVYLDIVLMGALANQQHHGRWLFWLGALAASTVWFSTLAFGASRLHRLFALPAAWRGLDGFIAMTMIIMAFSLFSSH